MNTKHKSFDTKWLILIVLIAALLLCGVAAAYYIIPGVKQPQLGKGDVTLSLSDNGKVLITWPAPSSGALSRVTVRGENEDQFRLLNEYPDNSAVVEGSILDTPFVLQIQSAVHGKNLLGMDREVLSSRKIEITVKPPRLMRPELSGAVTQPGELRLDWTGSGSCELFTVSGREYQSLGEIEGDSTTLHIGKDGDMELPSYDEPLSLTIRTVCRGDGFVLYGPYVQPVSVERSELLGNELSLECQELDSRNYLLRWNETKADAYEVREWSYASQRWSTIATISHSEPMVYDTGVLRSGTNYRFQIAAVGGSPEEPIAPEEVSLRAGVSTLYATIWPIIDVKLYSDAAMVKSLDTIPAGTALCVLEEDGDCFQVRYKDQYGYVDNRYCMINLPEYTGDFCAYSITNSSSSLFKVHDYPIEHITGEVIQGFEGVSTAEDGYLVPYLYPSARKLLTAAQAAEADGYRLRIYEAFRPNEATRYLYDTMLSQLDYPLPELDEQGNYIFYVPPEPEPEEEQPEETGTEPAPTEDTEPAAPPEEQQTLSTYEPEEGEPPAPTLPEEDGEPETPPDDTPPAEDVPEEPAPDTPPASDPDSPPESDESETGLQEEPQPEEEPQGPTYRTIMTDGRFGINSFLAASVSAHNRGIALDLTIEKLDGTKLEMQSPMHDLSWYSATYRNNDNAKLLASYMTMAGVGMRGLTSEWWHFQDDDTREAIGLNSYLYKGVTAEGWTRDKTGWRYRYADGRYAYDTSVRTGGKRYVINAEGYAEE